MHWSILLWSWPNSESCLSGYDNFNSYYVGAWQSCPTWPTSSRELSQGDFKLTNLAFISLQSLQIVQALSKWDAKGLLQHLNQNQDKFMTHFLKDGITKVTEPIEVAKCDSEMLYKYHFKMIAQDSIFFLPGKLGAISEIHSKEDIKKIIKILP